MRVCFCGALGFGLSCNGWAQPKADIIVFDEDDPAGAGYYDASVPMATSPSLLTTAPSPYGGKLPILTSQALSGAESGLLEWTSMPGGDWTVFIASPGFQTHNLTGYSNVVMFLNGPAAVPAASFPRVGLESSSNLRTATTELGTFLLTGLDADSNSWQRVVVPLSAFQPYGGFSPTQFKDVFFTQGTADSITRTVWLDNLRITDGHVPGTPEPLVTRAGDRSVVLHWPRNQEPDIAGYQVSRSLTTNGPFVALNPSLTELPSHADLNVTNGQPYFYRVRAINHAREESPDSMVAGALPDVFGNDDQFLEYLGQVSFDFFWYEANPQNGLIRDRSRPSSAVSIASVGFGLTGITIAIERGWITRDAGRQRVLATLRTFRDGPQGPGTSGTIGYKGWFYHFLDIDTATRRGNSELSSIDTGLLLAGILDVRAFFDQDHAEENEIRSAADVIFNRVDWHWMANGANSLTMGWHPESGFISARWIGYNEAMILYVMGLGAATNPLPPVYWSSWVNGYAWRTHYGQTYVEFPPLFGHQYSHCWIDFRHRADAYMNYRGTSYFENSRRATLAQRAYCIANPSGFAGYGSTVWGITACDGPGFGPYAGYRARGAPPAQNDDGTIAPTAVGGSLPFTPEICLPTLRFFYDQYRTQIWMGYGFRDAFNLTADWWATDVIGIDQGCLLLMLENYRTQNIWRRFMQIPEIQRGLAAAGFTEFPLVANGIRQEPNEATFTLQWQSAANRNYRVEFSPNMRDWFIPPDGFVTASSTTASWTDNERLPVEDAPGSVVKRFYRVYQLGFP